MYRWIPGDHTVGDADRFARDLAGFVTALHAVDTGGRTWNGVSRGGPLADQDDEVQDALGEIAGGDRLAAVLDLEAMAVGDPAVDLMPAWNLLPAGARDTYRRALHVDDATWLRGQGWAIVQAAVALPYYVDTNPVMAATARATLAAIMS